MSAGKANLRLVYRADEEAPSPPFAALDLELIRYVFSLPDEARAKLFAFLHLTESHRATEAEVVVSATGEVHFALTSKAEREAS